MRDDRVPPNRAWLQVLDDPSPNAALDWLTEPIPTAEECRVAFASLESGGARPPRRTAPGSTYDLYADLVFRHYGDVAAFQWLEGGRRLRSLSFASLHAHSTQAAGNWLDHGAKEGSTVCWIGHPGPDFVVSLVTALRLGLVFSWLPPYGSRYLEHRLAQLEPDLIVTEFGHLNRFHSEVGVLVPDRTPPPPVSDRPEARRSRPDDVALRLFSPIREAHDSPRDVTVGELHDGLLRDGLMALALEPGDAVAAPGLDDHQWQPHLILTTLLAGGTYWHLQPEEFRRLTEQQDVTFRWLGVSSRLRDTLIADPPAGLPCETWFRDPQNVHELQEWKRFTELVGLSDMPSANVLVDSAQGGVILQSVRRPGGAHPWVHPPPGRAWKLLDYASGEEAVGQIGEFASGTTPETIEATGTLLGRQGLEWAFGAARPDTRAGVLYPAAELLALLGEVDPAEGVTLLSLPNASSVGMNSQILLRFVSDPEAEGHEARVRQHIDGLLGERFQPDKIATYELFPRKAGDEVDHVWCATQYRMGLLDEKRKSPTHQLLFALRTAVRSMAPAPPVEA